MGEDQEFNFGKFEMYTKHLRRVIGVRYLSGDVELDIESEGHQCCPGWREKFGNHYIHIYVYTPTHIHICVYICICVCAYMCIYLYLFIYIQESG